MLKAIPLLSDTPRLDQTSDTFRDLLLRNEPPIFYSCDMPVPIGAPAQICLYGDFRPDTRETPLYLCNPAREAIHDVSVLIEWISIHHFYHADISHRWSEPLGRHEQHSGRIDAGRAVLVEILDHEIWDLVSRYSLTFLDGKGNVGRRVACDLALNVCRFFQEDSQPWVEFQVDSEAEDR